MATGEVSGISHHASQLTITWVGLVALSGLLGFMLSTSAFLVNRLVSATTMMVANNVNKFAVIILSEAFVAQTLGTLSSAGTLCVMFCGWFYAQTKNSYSSGRLHDSFARLGTGRLVISATL